MPTLRVSPHAVVRFESGETVVTAGLVPGVLRTADPLALSILAAFALARDRADAVAELSREASEARVSGLLDRLLEAGALLDTARPQEEIPDALADRDHSDARAVRRSVRLLATYASWLGRDLAAFRDRLPETWTGERAPVPRLKAIQADLLRLVTDLSRLRPRFVDEQLERRGLTRASGGLKLHIGPGGGPGGPGGSGEAGGAGDPDGPGSTHALAGFVSVGLAPADIVLDLGWGLPFADRSVSHAYLAHVLEHLQYPDEALRVAQELGRVLAPGGTVRIVVPDIEKCIRAYAEGDAEFFETRERFWPWAAQRRTRLEHFLEYAGAGIPPDAPAFAHKYGYDFETLRLLLERAGFDRIERSDYMASREPELRIDDAGAVAGASWRGISYSLFVEASRS